MTVTETYDRLKAEDPTEPHGLRLRSALLDAVIELERKVRNLEAEINKIKGAEHGDEG